MKNCVLLLITFLTINMVGQKVTYLDSIYLEYTKKGTLYYTTKFEPDELILLDVPYLRIATDELINKSLSDSLATTFKKKRVKSKKIVKDLEEFRDATALDSNLNVLYVKVRTHSCGCMSSLYCVVVSDEEILGLLQDKKCKSVITNYVQMSGQGNTSLIFITLRFRFKKCKTFSITMPLE